MYKDKYVKDMSSFPPDLPVSKTHIVMRSSQEDWRASHARIIRDFQLFYVLCIYTIALCVWCVNVATPQLWCVLGAVGVRRQPWVSSSLFPCGFWGNELRWSDSVASTSTWVTSPSRIGATTLFFGSVEKWNLGPILYTVGTQVTETHSQCVKTSQLTTALCYCKGPY